MPSPSPSGSTPESLFAGWLAKHEAGEEADLEVVSRAHPEHSAELRELHAQWERLERIRRRQAGGVNREVTQEAEDSDRAGFSSEVLTRLAGRAPASTRYRLEGEVAHGGMGAILRVWDEDLRRHLAMKVMLGQGLPEESGDTPQPRPKLLARFLEEAQVTGQLDHPGIVPVHELGLDREGQVYFTMKLVRGKTLEEVFDELAGGEGDWTQIRVLGLLLKVCEAMSYAHAKGVIHRDLKPANVMVGRYGEVYVMDWGLAKVLGREDERDIRVRPESALSTSEVRPERRDLAGETSDSPLYTMDGDVVGTPAYMSPEQAAGKVSEMAPPSDVYALGAMLYHLIAGHMPYVPPGARLNNYAVWSHVQGGPPRSLEDEAPDAPAELVSIAEKAMEREVEDRYADMSALAEDLSAYVEGRVVGAYEAGAWAEARKWVRRNRPLAAALATALVALVVGLVSSLMLKAQSDANAERADNKAEEAQANLALARRNEAEAREQRSLAEEQRARAKENERLARRETAKVLRLSDVKALQELEVSANDLWPAHPDRIDEMNEWLDRAGRLISRLDVHRSTLEEMRQDAAESAPDGEWLFEETADQWQHEVLAELIDGLVGLESGLLAQDSTTPEHGWSVPKRLAFAEELEVSFAEDGEAARAWSEALPAIRAAYPDLDLQPQMGLMPVGADPESGLWEFAHLMTGSPAARAADGKLVLTEEVGVVLVLLPGVNFWMGAQATNRLGPNYDPRTQSNESPVHEVRLKAYFLSKYEMTQGQWKRLTGRNPSLYGPDGTWASDWLSSGAPTSLLHPVEQVDWFDCMDWLPRVGLVLPSEAQWENGARGGTGSPWWAGSDLTSLWGVANVSDAYGKSHGGEAWVNWEEGFDDGSTVHAQVGTYAPNPFGLHEVHGNLCEWCLDGFEHYGAEPTVDPQVPHEGAAIRVYRDGSFGGFAVGARSAHRSHGPPSDAGPFLGVRPARVTKP